MGKYDFASWAIFLSFVIAFSTIWGLILKEWKGVSRRTLATLWIAIFFLILSAAVISMGSYSGEESTGNDTGLRTDKELADNMARGCFCCSVWDAGRFPATETSTVTGAATSCPREAVCGKRPPARAASISQKTY